MLEAVRKLLSPAPASPVDRCDLCGGRSFRVDRTFPSREWDPVREYHRRHPGEPDPYGRIPRSFRLLLCRDCGLASADPRLEDRVVNRFYDEYLGGKFRECMPSYDPAFREAVFAGYWERLSSLFAAPPRRALDVGCASGAFLKVFREKGVEGTGIEVSPRMGALAARHGEVLVGDAVERLEELPDRSFDLVTLVDSLEHFRSPSAVVKGAAAKLVPGGILFVETPNLLAGADVMSRHFFLFTEATLGRLLRENGVEIAGSVPGGEGYNPGDGSVADRFLRVAGRKG